MKKIREQAKESTHLILAYSQISSYVDPVSSDISEQRYRNKNDDNFICHKYPKEHN